VPGVALNIETSVWNIVPSSFTFISKHNISSIMPFQPSPESLG
jgi:hypothetical protein